MIISDSDLIKVAVFLPFLSGIFLLFGQGLRKSVVRVIACVAFVLPFLIGIKLLFGYWSGKELGYSYAFFSDFGTGLESFGISLKLGLNGISLPLFVLAGIVGLAAGFYALSSKVERLGLYVGLLLIMQAGLMGAFASIDIFFFYFFHELALIPTFILIGVYGGRGRVGIAMELTIYLTLGAMLSLIGIISIYMSSGLHSFDLISLKGYLGSRGLSEVVQGNIFGLLMFGFGILVSLFPFHSWAPRGYGAAPAPVAMMHAGVLKKFGLYGLIQIAVPLLPDGAGQWMGLLGILALGNILFIGFVTMAQKDLKQMIGYSSVMHMGYAFLGIVCFSALGTGAAVMIMFGHGLSVALLFLLSDAIYNRVETLDMKHIGGLSEKAPVLCGFFVAGTMASIGLPGFANFWGEIGLFVGLWKEAPWMVFLAVTGIVVSAVYGLRAVASIFFGSATVKFKELMERKVIGDISLREKISALVLLISLMVVGFWPKVITEVINDGLKGEVVLVSADLE